MTKIVTIWTLPKPYSEPSLCVASGLQRIWGSLQIPSLDAWMCFHKKSQTFTEMKVCV